MSNKENISSLFDRSGNLTPEAMQRYIKGQLGQDELKAVEAHLENSPFDREAIEGLRENLPDNLDQVLSGLDNGIVRAAKRKSTSSTRPLFRRYYWAAAAALISFAAVTVILVIMFRGPLNKPVAVAVHSTLKDTTQQVTQSEKPEIEDSQTISSDQNTGAIARADEKMVNEQKSVSKEPAAKDLKQASPGKEAKTPVAKQEIVDNKEEALTEEKDVSMDEPAAMAWEPEAQNGFKSGEKLDRKSEEPAVAYKTPVALSFKDSVIGKSKSGAAEDGIYTVVEQMPDFPGGEKALGKYLRDNVRYPEMASTSGIEGKVYVSFVIDTSGTISNVTLLRGIGGGCDEEALRVVKEMPKWIPGRQDGKPVRVSYIIPVEFTLQEPR